jgi:ornithine--oxo-acid transaminase
VAGGHQNAEDYMAQLTGADHIALTEMRAAHNYHPLPIVLSHGDGAWVSDVDGHRYLDCLAGYSALNFGHSHPRLLARAGEQLSRLTLTSRAFYNDQLSLFARDLTDLCDKEMMLPMNSGAEAVETAVKVARRWGHEIKGVRDEAANIIVMAENFHGRTTTIVSFSTDQVARTGYAPFTPGFRIVPFGDVAAIEAAIDDNTVAVLFEPIQGEAGIIVPPEGFLHDLRLVCTRHNVLMIADEIQAGLARTGETFACDHENVVPDMYILGKALGGGLLPLSAVVADVDVLGVITPGSHGSTFGGNPLACAIGQEVIAMLATGEFQQAARARGERLRAGLKPLLERGLTAIRCRGLWAGLDIDPDLMSGRQLAERLMKRGVLAKDTHVTTLRLAPPLVISDDDIDYLVDAVGAALG